ncbi:MAG: endonuclease NucS [Nocardioidaceae bacterium]
MRLVIARCQVDYAGRLTAHLPLATRLLIVKADQSVLVHADGGSYKPLNWMSPPCALIEGVNDDGCLEWVVEAKSGDTLRILIDAVISDSSYELGIDPGLQKDGVERHLQQLIADHPTTLSESMTLVRREYPTAIGPVDLLCRETHVTYSPDHQPAAVDSADLPAAPTHVAVEIKRKAGIDAVEQLSRYLELLNRDPLLAPVRGILAAQTIVSQARTLAADRSIQCCVIDYDELRGMDDPAARLF